LVRAVPSELYKTIASVMKERPTPFVWIRNRIPFDFNAILEYSLF